MKPYFYNCEKILKPMRISVNKWAISGWEGILRIDSHLSSSRPPCPGDVCVFHNNCQHVKAKYGNRTGTERETSREYKYDGSAQRTNFPFIFSRKQTTRANGLTCNLTRRRGHRQKNTTDEDWRRNVDRVGRLLTCACEKIWTCSCPCADMVFSSRQNVNLK